MNENKNQHFVPEFYFKFFSEDEKTIRIYNLKSKKHCKGPFSNQASKNYFYSENIEIEKSFFPIEGRFNEVLKKTIKKGLRPLGEEGWFELLRFITFQLDRTEFAKCQAKESTQKFVDNVVKPMMKSNKELRKNVSEELIDNLKITYPADFLYKILLALESNILLTDLVPVILVNQTDDDFIFSDNPIVKYNAIYCHEDHGLEGLQSPGLTVFCPLTPKRCLMLFDPVYYDLSMDENNEVIISNEEDIYKINKLQFHNCLKNIYYSKEESKEHIDKISEEFFSEYSKDGDLALMKEIENWKGDGTNLLVSSSKGIIERISFEFLKCAPPKRRISMFRNKEPCELFKERVKKLDSKFQKKEKKK